MKKAEIIFLPDEKNSKTLKVVLKGDLSIKNTGEIKDQILGNIKKYSTLEIQTEEVTAIDLSFYQLLISLKKQYNQTKKNLVFSLIISEEFEDLLKNAGLDINLN